MTCSKKCCRCGVEFKAHRADGKYCSRKCCVASQVRSPRSQEKVRADNYKADYGITIEQYNQMFVDQNGCCAICRKQETDKHWSGRIKNLSVDHDHKTGKIRGLLCNKCNRGIGFMNDDTELLQEAIEYLQGR